VCCVCSQELFFLCVCSQEYFFCCVCSQEYFFFGVCVVKGVACVVCVLRSIFFMSYYSKTALVQVRSILISEYSRPHVSSVSPNLVSPAIYVSSYAYARSYICVRIRICPQ
jgi:hypothetical protein